MSHELSVYLSERQQHVEQLLASYLASSTLANSSLLAAMRYAVLKGGKRLRPLLVYAMGETLGAPLSALDHAACAVELIHAYSLVHDDLPALDNDDWRRGQPACHKVFGEAVALLSADALQALAFEVLAKTHLSAAQVLKMLVVLTQSVGASGMVGGQILEFTQPLPPVNRTFLESVHSLKTGALVRACVQLARLAAHGSDALKSPLDQLGTAIGLAYQIQDDLNDTEHTACNYVVALGRSSAQNRLRELYQHIVGLLQSLLPQQTQPFYTLLDYMFFPSKLNKV